MGSQGRRPIRDLFTLGMALWGVGLAPPGARADSTDGLRARLLDSLRVEQAVSSPQGLEALYKDPRADPTARARALQHLFREAAAPLTPALRGRLMSALQDGAPEVRGAAARAVGELRERALERELLKRVAEDPDPTVRVAALRAVRPWSRQGHLYFLDQALRSEHPEVLVATLRNLRRVSYREQPPEVITRVEVLAGPFSLPWVRGEAVDTLSAWGQLRWDLLREVLLDDTLPEATRLRALEVSGPTGPEQEPVFIEILETTASLRLAWFVYQRFSTQQAAPDGLDPALARFLRGAGQENAATTAMADHLSARGYRAEFRQGAWKVTRR